MIRILNIMHWWPYFDYLVEPVNRVKDNIKNIY